jgi:hypothetical protein
VVLGVWPSNALDPTAVFELPVVLKLIDPDPNAVLYVPVVLKKRVLDPTATLQLASVL